MKSAALKRFKFGWFMAGCIVGMVLTVVIFGLFLDSPTPSDMRLRDNGQEWLRIGPKFIEGLDSSAVRISFAPHEEASLIYDKQTIVVIKRWIIENKFVDRFDKAPILTGYPLTEVRCPSVAFFSSGTIEGNFLIVSIPLTPLALGIDDKTYSEKIKELKKLVQTSAR